MTVIDATSTEIVPVSGLVELAAPIGTIVAAQRAHHDICAKLLDSGDYQSIGGNSFVKKSGWRKLALAYAVSCEILKEDYEHNEAGHIKRAKFVVRATAPNGRFMDGVGLCDSTERAFGTKADHDIPATAATRATNRACSDLFGLGEVSAEEVDASGVQYQAQVATRDRKAPAKAKPESGVKGVEALEDRLMKLSLENRGAFKNWRFSRGLKWPPESTEALRAMENEVGVLEARQEEEHAYEDAHPVGSSFD